MRRIEVSPTKFDTVTVEGGWIARVPTISVTRSDPRFQEMIAGLMRLGAPPSRAEEEAITSVQGLFEGSWVTKLKMMVGRAARDYEERFGSLDGFDPERVQTAFIPGGDRFWRKGEKSNVLLNAVFDEMRRNVR